MNGRIFPIAEGRLEGDLDGNGKRVTDLGEPELDGDAATKGYVDSHGGTPTWSDIKDKPTEFPPSAHTHQIGDVETLDLALAEINVSLMTKVEQVEGKGLSTNDYTEEDKATLANKRDKTNRDWGSPTFSPWTVTADQTAAPALVGASPTVSIYEVAGEWFVDISPLASGWMQDGPYTAEGPNDTSVSIHARNYNTNEEGWISATRTATQDKFALTSELAAKATELNARIDLIETTSHPNMSIVGAPTFREGVVSGFSANDYLMFPTNVDVKENEVDFFMAFTTGANVTTQQNILDSWCGLAFAIQNGGTVTAASQNGTTFVTATSAGTVMANSSYRLKLEFRHADGMYTVTTKLASGSGDYAQVGGVVTLTAPLHPTATYWGGANPTSGVHHIFGGSINLSECHMEWNGSVVWRGYDELPTVKFDPTAEKRLDTAEKILNAAEEACAVNPGTSLSLNDRDCCLVAYDEGMTFTFAAKEEGQTGLRSFEVIVTGCVKDGAVNWPAVTYRGDSADLIPDDGDNHWTFAEQQDGSFAVTRHVANTFTIGE